MIKREDLLEAIAECKGVKNPNANTCLMLSAFYTILDHMDAESESVRQAVPMMYSYEKAPQEEISYDGGTEFSQAVHGKSADEIMEVMDELMSTLQALHPRLYAGVMRKVAE